MTLNITYIDTLISFVKNSTQNFPTRESYESTSFEGYLSTETVPKSGIITSQVSTIPHSQSAVSIITSGTTSQVASTSQHAGTNANMNTLIAAVIAQLIQPSLTNQIGQLFVSASPIIHYRHNNQIHLQRLHPTVLFRSSF